MTDPNEYSVYELVSSAAADCLCRITLRLVGTYDPSLYAIEHKLEQEVVPDSKVIKLVDPATESHPLYGEFWTRVQAIAVPSRWKARSLPWILRNIFNCTVLIRDSHEPAAETEPVVPDEIDIQERQFIPV